MPEARSSPEIVGHEVNGKGDDMSLVSRKRR